MKTLLLLIIALALPVVAWAADAWKDYVNARFGFKVSLPASLVASPEPANGAGREFHTKNKDFSILAHGHFLNGETLESAFAGELRDLGGNITYQRKARDWYVVSGVNDGSEFYVKRHVKGGNWSELRFIYPHAKAGQYDPWVERIVKSFVPFLDGPDYDRIVK